MLKRPHQQGINLEREVSRSLHKEGVPLLISPLLLRRRGCGQIDVSIIKKDHIIVAECKYGRSEISYKQRLRLWAAGRLLLVIFDKPVQLLKIKTFAKSFDSAYPFNRYKIGELR